MKKFFLFSLLALAFACTLAAPAHARGVDVQMVVNDNGTSKWTAELRRALGHNVHKDNFVFICHQSCRGGAGNLHLKVYSFDKTGGARDVIMTGSTNLTDRAVHLQWNDLFTIVGDEGLFDTWLQVFNQLKKDKAVADRIAAKDLEDCFDLGYHTKHVDTIFARVFGKA